MAESGIWLRARGEDGRLRLHQPAHARQALRQYDGRDVLLHVMPVGALPLKKFYYSVVLRIVREHTGYTKAEANLEMKRLFLPAELVEQASIATLTTTELQDLIADIQRWAAEGGLRADRRAVYIPDPNEAIHA